MKASEQQVAGGHYRDFAIQPSEFIQRNKLGWCEGNVIKYAARHRHKNGAEDIKKAIHYLNLLLEWEYGEAADPAPPADEWAAKDLCRRCGYSCNMAGVEREIAACGYFRPKEATE